MIYHESNCKKGVVHIDNMEMIIFCFFLLSVPVLSQNQKKNVLFIAVDDLRPQLNAYGYNYISSPNIDGLAAKSILFERAYCQVAVCSPSRASLLTGRRPDTNHVWTVSDDEYWRTVPDATNATTIPQYFKDNGYVSIGMGKIFHPGAPGGNNDEQYSWSPEGLPYYDSREQVPAAGGVSWYSLDYEDNQLSDGKLADRAVSVLQELKQNETNGDTRPFFLAVGFHKPHLPFYCPLRYYNLYPPEEILMPENPDAPVGMPEIAWSVAGELRNYNDITIRPLCRQNPQIAISGDVCRISANLTRELRRGYYACVSYIDAQVGRIVTELESQGFGNDTVIVFWGDHGWQLGEHNEWSKNTNFEDATRVPFMIRVPGVTDSGIRTSALVELIDIFPSLTELAGIDVPPMCNQNSGKSIACVEGTSVVPLLKDPNREWKKGAFSQFPRPAAGLLVITGQPPFEDGNNENVMGYSVRVDKYRFTEWYYFNRTTSTPNFTDIWGTELYNHTHENYFFNDENINLANDPDMASIVTELRSVLQNGWRDALPQSVSNNTSTAFLCRPFFMLIIIIIMMIFLLILF